MKRRITAIAAAALVLSAVSCGSSDDSSSVSVKVGNTTGTSTETTAETTTEAETTETKTTEAETTEEKTTEAETTEAETEEPTTEETTEPTTETEPETTEAPTEGNNAVAIDGNMYLGSEINELKDLLGEQQRAYMAEACLPIGDDGNLYVYDFGGVTAECYIQSETHYIYELSIASNSYSTPEGITVGYTKEDVEAAYGAADVQGNGDLYYNMGTYDLYFAMSGDVVGEVQYILNY